MVSQKQTNQLMVIGIFALAIVGFGMWTGWNPLSIGGGQTPAGVTGTGVCPTGTGLATVYHKVTYQDTSTNQQTQANTSVALYLQGEKTVTASGTTSTSGYSNVGSVNCGAKLSSYYGDGGTIYYYQKVDTSATNAAQVYMDAAPKRSSAATLSFSNTSAIGQSSINVAINNGTTNSDVSMVVKAGGYNFGDSAFEVCAMFNATNITKVSFGAGATEIAADSSMTAGTGNTVKCYEVAQQLYNYNSVTLPVVIQAKSGVLPTTAYVALWINDKSSYLKDGELVPSYFNADTNADLGLSRVGSATAVLVDGGS